MVVLAGVRVVVVIGGSPGCDWWGCWPRLVGGGLPAAVVSAGRGRGGSMSRDQGGKFWAERSGPR